MKLSEMNTDELSEALCALVEPLSRIASDAELDRSLTALSKRGGGSVLLRAGGLIFALAPVLRRRRAECYEALSILTGKTPKQLAAQRGLQTLRDLRAVFDRELLDFFVSCGR